MGGLFSTPIQELGDVLHISLKIVEVKVKICYNTTTIGTKNTNRKKYVHCGQLNLSKPVPPDVKF